MRNKKDYYVVSVESRKGGVGKTSVALNLARILIKSGNYEVLFLDLDIVGTEAAKCVPDLQEVSEYFSKDLLYILQDPDTKSPVKPLNLVEMFERYMTGEKILSPVEWDGNPGKEIALKRDKINIFSSHLRRDYGARHNNSHTYGPATLFDEMHSQWFITMIKDFIAGCAEKLTSDEENKDKKLVVVIDNSPGYSGLAPVVEEWLTDIGPKFGKFLFVCSMDIQDMTACLDSIRESHKLYSEKWGISRDFIDMFQKGKTIEEYWISDNVKAFFNRLAESLPDDYNLCQYANHSENHDGCTRCGLCFYRQEKVIGKKYVDHAARFLALIANRVPRAICDGNLTFNINDLLKGMDYEPDKDFTLKNVKEFNPENIEPGLQVLIHLKECLIPHKDRLSMQFSAKRLVRDVNKNIEELIEKIDTIKCDFLDKFSEYKNEKLLTKEDLKNSLDKGINLGLIFHEMIDNARKMISNMGLQGVEEFWDERFSPLLTDLELVNTIGKINEKRTGEYFNLELDELIPKLEKIIKRKSEIFQVAEDLFMVKDLPEVKEMGISLDVLRDMALAAVKVFDENFNMDAQKIKDMIIILCYIHIVCCKWSNRREIIDINNTGFWQKHSDDINIIKDAILENPKDGKIIDNVTQLLISGEKYPDVYMKFCKMKARIMDVDKDFELLILIFKRIILKKNPPSDFHSSLRKLAERIIVKKNLYDRTREQILEEMLGPDFKEFELVELVPVKGEKFFIPKDEITIFDKVIRRILKKQWKWNLN